MARTFEYEYLEDENLTALNAEEVERLIPLIVFMLLICVTGVSGNGLVIYIYRTKIQNSSSRWFIFFLGVVDLISCILVVPCEVLTTFMQYNFTDPITCKVTVFMNLWCLLSLATILVLTAVDRYRKVCQPLGWQINPRIARVLSLVSLVCGMLLAVPVWWVYGIHSYQLPHHNITVYECSTRSDSAEASQRAFSFVLLGMVLFIISLVTICVLYCLIGLEIQKHVRKQSLFRNLSLGISTIRRREVITPQLSPDITTTTSDDDGECTDGGIFSDDDTFDALEDRLPKKLVVPKKQDKFTRKKSKRIRRTRARKATFSMFLISLAFVISYLPLLILLLIRSTQESYEEHLADSDRAVFKFFLRSYFLNYAINPFIYGVSDSSFRTSCKATLSKLKTFLKCHSGEYRV